MTPPTDETPAQSFARVAAASEAAEEAAPPAPSREVMALRTVEAGLAHLESLSRFASHLPTCGKDISPAAVLVGKVVACSCGLDPDLEAAASFVHRAMKLLG